MHEDPRDVGIGEKADLMLSIEHAAKVEGIVNTRANYIERFEEVTFRDSSGASEHYGICRSGFGIMAVASKNGSLQMGYERRHSIRGLNIRHQQELGRAAGERAVALLSALPARGGTMNAVLDPELAGVFAHEAVGHASEGDLIQEGNSVLAGRKGEKIGNPIVTIVDDPSLHEFGFEPCDAEGSRVERTEIISRGVVGGFLHSRETLAAVGNGHAGNARAMPGDPPLVRMSNTFIEPGDSSLEEITRRMQERHPSERIKGRAGRPGKRGLPVQCRVWVPNRERGMRRNGPRCVPFRRDPPDTPFDPALCR